jgi:Transposase DNA-binding
LVPTDWTSLGETHFGSARLGDARRTRRLVKTAALLMTNPAGTLPEKLPEWADLMGLYRLAAAPGVTHLAVTEPHRRRTVERMRQTPGVVLLVHDTTELDYTGHGAVASELSHIGNGGRRGYLCHNTLAVTPAGEVIGLAGQVLHLRRRVPRGETARAKRDHPGRESLLWQRGCDQVGPAPAGAAWVDVCDRGADAFEFLEYEHARGRHYVIRAAKDRALDGDDHPGADRIHRTLFAYARDLPTLGHKQVAVPASTRKGSKARTAAVRVAAGPVVLAAPGQPRGRCTASSVPTWVVHVAEVDPPPGVVPLEWVLLTDVPAGSLEQAAERVDWYECRPVVEDYHKGLKTGIGIELPQFESADRLEPVIGLLSVVAAVLLGLRHLARSPAMRHVPAVGVLPPLWVRIVAQQVYRPARKMHRRAEDLSVEEFFVGVARMGGHLARKNDGPPGWQTLWRGWHKLHLIAQGAELVRKKCV